MPNPTPDLIPRSAVLEAIEAEIATVWPLQIKAALRRAHNRISALPACPAAHLNYVTPEESQSRAFDAMAKRDDFTMTDSTPEVKRLLRDNMMELVDEAPEAPQPVLDYTAMTPGQLVKFIFAKTECDTREGDPENLGLLGVCARTISELIAPQPAIDVAALVARAEEAARNAVNHELLTALHTALTTLAAQLAQAEARAERAEESASAAGYLTGRAAEWVISDASGERVTQAAFDALAARLAEVERERDEWKSYKDRVEVSERERDTDRARLHASDDLAVKNAIERDAYKESVQGAGVVIHRIKAERDAALTRAAAAEKALAEDSHEEYRKVREALGLGAYEGGTVVDAVKALKERATKAEAERDEYKSRVDITERERDTDRARLHASDDLAVKNAIERDAYKESVQGAGVVIHRIKAERDAALTRAAAAEKALAEAESKLFRVERLLVKDAEGVVTQAVYNALVCQNQRYKQEIEALGKVENINMPHGVIAIRRVLPGGAGNLSVTYGADPEAATTKEVNVDATHR